MTPDPLLVCRALGGLATAAQLAANGVPRRAVEAAVTTGRLRRVRRGVVADAALPDAVLHAVAHGGRLDCHSLLKARGLWTLPDPRLHLHLAAGTRPLLADACGPRRHYSDGRSRGNALAVDVLPSLAELARCLGTEHLVVALDSARRLGLVRDTELPTLRRALPPVERRVPDASSAVADSGLESLVRWRLLQRGIEAQPQFRLRDGRRRDLRVGRLLIETDGDSHDDPKQHAEDMRRDAFASREGYITLRFGYRQVVHEWPSTGAAIFARIDRGLHLEPIRWT